MIFLSAFRGRARRLAITRNNTDFVVDLKGKMSRAEFTVTLVTWSPHSQGRKARGPAGTAPHQIRADHESQDRQRTQPPGVIDDADACRRGDRMRRRLSKMAHLGHAAMSELSP